MKQNTKAVRSTYADRSFLRGLCLASVGFLSFSFAFQIRTSTTRNVSLIYERAFEFSVDDHGVELSSLLHPDSNIDNRRSFLKSGVKSILNVAVSTIPFFAGNAFADEYGRETEAPTLGTGESVMICTKRGPLGACLKTERRTEENDNDKSEKYFRQPMVNKKDDEARKADSDEGNVLIQRLKKQSEDNSEKNKLLVRQRTLMNDSSASFGPFDSQVLILNEDGNGFTLLANPQAMRLKKQGLIENKKFIRQPTQEELDAALQTPDSLGSDILDQILGSS